MAASQNIITISEDLVNNTLKRKLLSSSAGEYITGYRITFSQGYIYLDLNLRIKTLGPLAAKYRLEVVDFSFRPGSHKIIADYVEDVRSTGSLMQGMMLKAAAKKGSTFLQAVIAMTNPPGIKADAKSCSIDLEQLLKLSNEAASMLVLKYEGSRDGTLRFEYQLIL